MMRAATAFAIAFAALLGNAQSAKAFPILQLYIEGSTYDAATQTWVIESNGAPFKIWVIGNTSQPPGPGPNSILDVKLAAAYASTVSDLTVSLTPTTASASTGFTDPFAPTGTGGLLQTVTDGSSPLLSTGASLPDHGIYGTNTTWHGVSGADTAFHEFDLGDMTLLETDIADFTSGFTGPQSGKLGQINAYTVSITTSNPDPVLVHFDAYDHVEGSTHAKFAPFSHDGQSSNPPGDDPPGPGVVPEPSSLLLAALGALGVPGIIVRRRRRNQKGDAA